MDHTIRPIINRLRLGNLLAHYERKDNKFRKYKNEKRKKKNDPPDHTDPTCRSPCAFRRDRRNVSL